MIFFISSFILNFTIMCDPISIELAEKLINEKEFRKLNPHSVQIENEIYFVNRETSELLVYNLTSESFCLNSNYKNYFNELTDLSRYNLISPLFYKRKDIEQLDNVKQKHLNDLFAKLCVEKPITLDKINVKELDESIKNYGYENAYKDLFLNIIIFCGQYVIEEKGGGGWEIETNYFKPLEYSIFYLNKKGEKKLLTNYVTEYLYRRYRDSDDIYISNLDEIIEILSKELF